MRAAVLRRFGERLELADVPEPLPAAGEALVRVRATGICATDLKVTAGALDGVRLPLIPGHEVAGELVEPVGELAAGQRVACYLYASCGACRSCADGRPTLCPEARRIGIERDGGMAEYVCLPAACLVPFGPSLDFAEAAVSMDAVMTPWRALRGHGALSAGESVAVVGAGGLGLNAVQIAADAGARTAVVEPSRAHRELALELGAELAVRPDELAEVREWSGGGVDLALDTSGVRAGFDTALASLRPGGRLVCCGYRPGVEYGLDSAKLVLDEIALVGSRAGSYEDARDALAAVEEGRIRPAVMERLPLDRVNDALRRLLGGAAIGRLVLDPAQPPERSATTR